MNNVFQENVQFFLDGCRRVGLKEDMLFEPYDIKYFGSEYVSQCDLPFTLQISQLLDLRSDYNVDN